MNPLRLFFASRMFTLLLALLLLVGATLPAAAATAADTLSSSPGGFQIVASNDNETIVSLAVPAYTLRTVAHPAGACQVVDLDGYAQSGQDGAPQLPVIGTLLGVPAQAMLSAEIISAQSEPLPDSFVACPAPQAVAEEGEAGVLRYVEREAMPDAALFAQSTPYPAQIATVEDLGFMRSQRMARLQISPVQITPATATGIIYRQVQVRVRHAGGSGIRSAEIKSEPDLFEKSLQGTLLNYAQRATLARWRKHTGCL